MSKVVKDGNFTIVGVPKKDLDSLIRFVAHSIEKNSDKVLELSYEIVRGDLSKQDSVVDELITLFDVNDWSIILDGPEALELCDELAEKIYEEKPQVPGLLYKICVHCHKSYAGQCECPGFKRSQLKVVK